MSKSFPLRRLSVFAAIAVGLLFATLAKAQEKDFAELAHRVVTSSVAVKPGDVVVISGGKHTIPLMEALAIEAQKAGGLVTMFLNSDKVIRSRYTEVPEKHLEIEPRYAAEWFKQVDVFISLPDVSDIKAIQAGVSAERFAKMDKAGQFMLPLLDEMKFREVDIILPTAERARSFHVDPAVYNSMIWEAIGADTRQMAANGAALKKALQGAKKVRVTSPSGTDLTFAVSDRPIFVEDGTVPPEKAKSHHFIDRTAGLPGGGVTVAPLESSASGKVVVPRSGCRFDALTGVSFTFQNGKMENFKAGDGNQCFQDLISASAGDTRAFASFNIGLNPGFKVHEENGAVYYPAGGLGLVFISIGDNEALGGKNRAQGGFNYAFPIVNATVEVDGKVVVKNGKLTL
jgi:aminopeptidase